MALVEVSEDTFNDMVTQEGIVLVDAWAEWCGPCRQFMPVYKKASEKHEDITFAKAWPPPWKSKPSPPSWPSAMGSWFSGSPPPCRPQHWKT